MIEWRGVELSKLQNDRIPFLSSTMGAGLRQKRVSRHDFSVLLVPTFFFLLEGGTLPFPALSPPADTCCALIRAQITWFGGDSKPR